MEPAEYGHLDANEAALWWYRALHARLLAALGPVRGRVLDAGCGTGGLLRALAAARPELQLTGVESYGPAAARAAAKSGVAVTEGSIGLLPFADATFDAAIAADVLCHVGVEPGPALSELGRILRPGGLLVVNMPAYQWLLASHDRRVHNARRVSAGQLRRLLEAGGFVGTRTRYWNSLLLPVMVARRKLGTHNASSSDVTRIPRWLDTILHGVTRLERRLPVRLPAGGSVLATARRP